MRRNTTGLVATLRAICSEVTGSGRFLAAEVRYDSTWMATVMRLLTLMGGP
jgi:hypothetical protein